MFRGRRGGKQNRRHRDMAGFLASSTSLSLREPKVSGKLDQLSSQMGALQAPNMEAAKGPHKMLGKRFWRDLRKVLGHMLFFSSQGCTVIVQPYSQSFFHIKWCGNPDYDYDKLDWKKSLGGDIVSYLFLFFKNKNHETVWNATHFGGVKLSNLNAKMYNFEGWDPWTYRAIVNNG